MHHCTVATVGCLAMSLAMPAHVRVAAQRGPVAAGNAVRGGLFPRQLTIFDRHGDVVKTLADPDIYQQPAFSPDGTQLAVVKLNRPAREQHVWVLDLARDTSRPLTSGAALDSAPAWSSDGQEIAYSSYRGYGALYRQPAAGSASKTLVYRTDAGTTLGLTDWSSDGRLMTYTSGGVLFSVRVGVGSMPIEVLRDEFTNVDARISPDRRFIAYRSDESGRNEIYVRGFDASSGVVAGDRKWRISEEGGLGLISWRRDGQELYYLASNGGVMAVPVSLVPEFKAGHATVLFQAPGTIPLTGTPGGLAAVSADGQRFAFAAPMPPRRIEMAVGVDILRQYVGTYAGPAGNDVVVALEDEHLSIQPSPGLGTFRLYASSETSFFFQTAEPEIDFVRDQDGRVTHFILYQDGRMTRAMRK
jgi:Tol biopolymer transport system component